MERKLTKEDKIKAYAMLLDGHTLQSVADSFGVTRQRIQQIIPVGNMRKEMAAESCIYPNLSKWMMANKVGYTDLATITGLRTETIRYALSGKRETRKGVIDAVLAATGLSYEHAFGQ